MLMDVVAVLSLVLNLSGIFFYQVLYFGDLSICFMLKIYNNNDKKQQ